MIDLRSDTVTLPSKEMKQFMFNAPLGDDVYGDDPTINELEEKASNLFGKEDAIFVTQEIDKFVNENLLPEMKKIYAHSSIKKQIIGEIIGFNRVNDSKACEFVSSITGDNEREVVSFGTEAGLFQEIGISTVVCGPGSIEQAHKIDEFIELSEIKKCLLFLEGVKNKSIIN